MAPGDLQEVLEGLKLGDAGRAHPDLLVGLGRADDAAVYRVADDMAIVETVDFFPPVVDDAYTWGAIAAANALSDVYAMGGQVLFALAVAGFPREFPKSIVTEVFRGGAEKLAEAGGVLAGGHTVVDAEPKYGLCVAESVGVRGATDITGFGFLGHVAEMVQAAGAGVSIDAGRLPLLEGAQALADKGHWSGGMKRNRRWVEATLGGRLSIGPGVAPGLAGLLFESETSGGLLFATPPATAGRVREGLRARGEPCVEA